MINTRKLYKKYKNVILYLFFGACTTLVNIVSYWIAAYSLKWEVMISTVVAWFLAVLFAYITNRKWVFHSETRKSVEILKEIVCFFTCRLTTGVIDWLCMFIFVETLVWNDIVIKFCANIVVIVLNYAASKLLIFNRKGK